MILGDCTFEFVDTAIADVIFFSHLQNHPLLI